METTETQALRDRNEEIKIHFFKSEEDPSKKRIRFYQNFQTDREACYFDLADDVPHRIVKDDPGATAGNPLTLVLRMTDHGYAGRFQVMAFVSEDTTYAHPPTTMIRIHYGNSGKELVGRIFDNSIFSRLDLP